MRARKPKKWSILATMIVTQEAHLRAELHMLRERYPAADVRAYGRVVRAGGAAVPVTVIVARKEQP